MRISDWSSDVCSSDLTELGDNINHAIFYPDLLNLIRLQGGNDLDHNRLFQEKYYSWSPPIDLAKFVNYQNYLWLPDSLRTQLVNTILHSRSEEHTSALQSIIRI